MGTQLFGSNSAWLLLGFLCVQTHTYYTRSAKDPPIFKALVYSTVLISMAESIVEAFVSYSFLVSGWGNPRLLAEFPEAIDVLSNLVPLFDALPALFVQAFFTWRIYAFGTSAFSGTVTRIISAVCIFILLTSLCAFISAIVLTALLISGPIDNIPPGTTVLVWSLSTAIADVTITVCMMIILYHAKASACFGETRDRFSRLLRLTIQTGFVTSILALPIAPLYIHVQVGIYTLTCFLLGKSYVFITIPIPSRLIERWFSYAISLLANLNARSYRPTQIHGKNAEKEVALSHLSAALSFALAQNTNSSDTLLVESHISRVGVENEDI